MGLAKAALYVLGGVMLMAVCSKLGKRERSPDNSSVPTTITAPPQPAPAEPVSGETPKKSLYAIEHTEVRLGPSAKALETSTVDRQDELDIYETKDGWARISKFYDGSIEGLHGPVARWVPLKLLSEKRPKDLPQPAFVSDARIEGLPKVGDDGLTKRDVQVLQAAARYFLETGEAQRIELGNKSVSKLGVYYLNFGGLSNRFFKPSDIPDLERRIREAQK